MRFKITGLASALLVAFTFAASAPAEAGWKWKKMKWVPKHGQEYRSPYAQPDYGYGPREGYRYRGGYGYDRGYGRPDGYGRPYGYGAPYYGQRRGPDW